MTNSIYHPPLIIKLAKKLNIDLTTIKGSGLNGKIRKVDLVDTKFKKNNTSTAFSVSDTYLTPLVKKYASSKQVDPSNIQGSGINARIRKFDIDLFLKNRTSTPDISQTREVQAPRSTQFSTIDYVSMLNSTAQLSTTIEVDFTHILQQIAKSQDELLPISYLIQASVQGIKQMPIINSYLSTDAKEIQYNSEVNLGFEDEIVLAKHNVIISNADNFNLLGLSRNINGLRNNPTSSTLLPTFGIQDHSKTELIFSTPIVKSPASALISLGKIVKKATAAINPENSDTFSVRQMAYVTLSYDHRIIDGADAARFLSFVKDYLENFTKNS